MAKKPKGLHQSVSEAPLRENPDILIALHLQ